MLKGKGPLPERFIPGLNFCQRTNLHNLKPTFVICFLEEMGTAIMDNLQRDREVMTRTRERVSRLIKLV